MQSDQLYQQLRTFLQTDPACVKALSCLDPRAQIGIVIGGALKVCVHVDNNQIHVENAQCPFPDFVFHANPLAVETMISEKNLSPSQLGIKFLKQLLTHQVTLAMPGHLFQVIRKGYLKILTVGGLEFLGELRKFNLGSIAKITKALKALRK